MHFYQMQSRELNPVKKDVIQLLVQDSYSEVIGKVAGRRFDLGSQSPGPPLLQSPMSLKSASVMERLGAQLLIIVL